MSESNIFNPEIGYKPQPKYSWARDIRKIHEGMHWTPEKVDHSGTKSQFYDLSSEYQEVILRILKFFTQADTAVNNNYTLSLMPIFQDTAINLMYNDFSNREAIHIEAYAKLLETLDMTDEKLNNCFTDYKKIKEMVDKEDFLNEKAIKDIVIKSIRDGGCQNLTDEEKQDILLNLATFALFTEGLQLWSSFAILYEPRHMCNGGILRAIAETVDWSAKDELVHVAGNLRVVKQIIQEFPELWTTKLKEEIYNTCNKVVHLEDAFIDYVFKPSNGVFFTLTSEKVKEYIRYMADTRLRQLGLKGVYLVKESPLPDFDAVLKIAGVHGNFFEAVLAHYAHNRTTGSWDNCIYN